MKKIFLVFIIIILLLLGGYYYSINFTKNLRERVLNELGKNLEFCEIVKDKVNPLSKTGKFWLWCNGRPFYAEWKEGLRYELNGWGWLKDTKYWERLKNCEYYQTEGGGNTLLYFYCIEGEDDIKMVKMKITQDFNVLEVEESDFIPLLIKGVKETYPLLKNCRLSSFSAGNSSYDPIDLYFECDSKIFRIFRDKTVQLMPPILVEEKGGCEEKIKESVRFFNDCSLIEVNCPVARISCENIPLTLVYDFEEKFVGYSIPFVDGSLRLAKYFILPPIGTNFSLVKEERKEGVGNVYYYLDDRGNIIMMIEARGRISHLLRRLEGMIPYA